MKKGVTYLRPSKEKIVQGGQARSARPLAAEHDASLAQTRREVQATGQRSRSVPSKAKK